MKKQPAMQKRPEPAGVPRLFITTREFQYMLNCGRDKWYSDVMTHPEFPQPIAFAGANKKLWPIWKARRFARVLAGNFQ